MKAGSSLVRHRQALVIGFMAVFGGGTAWMLADGSRGGVIAGVLAFTATTLTLAAPLLGAP